VTFWPTKVNVPSARPSLHYSGLDGFDSVSFHVSPLSGWHQGSILVKPPEHVAAALAQEPVVDPVAARRTILLVIRKAKPTWQELVLGCVVSPRGCPLTPENRYPPWTSKRRCNQQRVCGCPERRYMWLCSWPTPSGETAERHCSQSRERSGCTR